MLHLRLVFVLSVVFTGLYAADPNPWGIPSREDSITLIEYQEQTVQWLLELGQRQLETEAKDEAWYQSVHDGLPEIYRAWYLGGSGGVIKQRRLAAQKLLETFKKNGTTHISLAGAGAVIGVDLHQQQLGEFFLRSGRKFLPEQLTADTAPFAVLIHWGHVAHWAKLKKWDNWRESYQHMFKAMAIVCTEWKDDPRASSFVITIMDDAYKHPADEKTSKSDHLFEYLGEEGKQQIDQYTLQFMKGDDAIIKAWDGRGSG
jgi:hypothetical protein